MNSSAAVFEQRRRPRVQLNLPVRLRWPGPLRQLTEITVTLDVSRGGLLFYRRDPCPANAPVWVTFPYDAETSANQPETPARVVRVKTTPAGGHLVAVEFEAPQRSVAVVDFNRRIGERILLALPIRVRLAGTPWPEEAMTVNVSEGGVMFQTARQYNLGDPVYVTLPYGRWGAGREVEARVVRTAPIPGSVEQRVALSRVSPPKQ